MPKDALTIYRAAGELDVLTGGRIDKVAMPKADTLVLLIHSHAGNKRLVLSCNPSLPRAHITSAQYKSPETATGMLMYFRKRLTGAVLTEIKKYQSERMITLKLSALNELRERVTYYLHIELTGKCANIIFTDADGTIGNALRRITAEMPGKRTVIPGLPYSMPEPTGRIGVFDGELVGKAVSLFPLNSRDAVNKTVAGLSVTTVDEIFSRIGGGDAPVTAQKVNEFAAAAREMYTSPLSPVTVFDGDKPLDYFIEPYGTIGGKSVKYQTLNAAMDAYYSKLFDAAELTANAKPLRTAVKSAVNRNAKRLSEALAKLAESESAEEDKQLGDIITANIYRIKRGDESVTADNFYDCNGGKITIKLDVTKNAQQNAAAFYKSYNKNKRAAIYAAEAEAKARAALYELEGISAELELCTNARELDEVREELVSLGLLKPTGRRKKEKPVPSEPYSFDIDGVTLLVGKNHAQNDRITRSAARNELWLHVKNAHGCHAVLKTPSPTEDQIVKAAEKAAYYSQARGADKADVDYTLIKFVYPHGGGRVEYKEYKTVTVVPKP